MIEQAKLTNLLQAEIAASKFWDGLTPKEKKAYLKAHPKSKYGKGGSGPQVVSTKDGLGMRYPRGTKRPRAEKKVVDPKHDSIVRALDVTHHHLNDGMQGTIARHIRKLHEAGEHGKLRKYLGGLGLDSAVGWKHIMGALRSSGDGRPKFDAKSSNALRQSTHEALTNAGLSKNNEYSDAPQMAPHTFWNVREYEPKQDAATRKKIHQGLTNLGYQQEKPSASLRRNHISFAYHHPIHRHSVVHNDVGISHFAPTEHGFDDSE